MPVSILRRPTVTSHWLAPVEPRYAPLFCLALLTAACALASFAFACATPLAAFAVIAAAMLPLRSALFTVAAAWLVNQAIGFGLLGYPADGNTILWGIAIGVAALVATATASSVRSAMPRMSSPAALLAALIGAYAAYELVLFAATPFLGGAADFSLAIVARLGLLNLIWLIGLVAVCEAARLFGAMQRRQRLS